jgi:ribosome-binding factor A
MTNNFKRTDRIAELIQRKLAYILQQEVKDPRMPKFVTITSVKVSADLSHAKVYFSVFEKDKDLALSILTSASGYLRSVLAKAIKARTIPQLHFIHDDSLAYGQRIDKLLDEVIHPDDESDEKD